ncbi:MAG: ATP-binding protein [Cyanobacteria bacterium P01_F01_bin.150]
MKLKHKLIGGYAIALGVATLGTLNGVWLGNHYQQRALTLRNQAAQEQKFLNQLQIDILYNRPAKQLLPHIHSSEDFQRESQALLWRMEAIQSDIVAYNRHGYSPVLTDLPALLQDYEQTIDRLIKKTRTVLDMVDPLIGSPEHAKTVRGLLLELLKSQEFIAFIEFPNQLFPLNQVAHNYEVLAGAALHEAEVLRMKMILSSLALSIIISTILSWHLSRAIAHPLAAVTQTAQQVTQDENFDLRVMVNTDDEVGSLAIAINQLIYRVGALLEQQRQSASMQELFQNEKMAMLGRMVSEVAHEINNPVNCIHGNLKHANNYINDLFSLLHVYDETLAQVPEEILAKIEEIDRDFIEEDLPKLIQSMSVGSERAKQIALSLRNFSRLDDSKPTLVNLQACLQDTLIILSNRLKRGIMVVQDYSDLPLIPGYSGPLYQVFTNLINNGIDALLASQQRHPKITITTQLQPNSSAVSVHIKDNGPGIDPEHLPRIFDALFTTKPSGVGTGLGLSISQQIIEEQHQGKLLCASQLGQGTTFTVILPMQLNETLGNVSPHNQPTVVSEFSGVSAIASSSPSLKVTESYYLNSINHATA